MWGTWISQMHTKILPTAKLLATWMAYLGLAFGVLYSVGGFFVDLLTIGLNWGTAMAFGALVGMPLKNQRDVWKCLEPRRLFGKRID